MSEAKLKTLKVVDLKDILAKASVSVPAKANKQDLIARILGSPAAIEVYNKQQNPNAVPSSSTTADDLVCLKITGSLEPLNEFTLIAVGTPRRAGLPSTHVLDRR